MYEETKRKKKHYRRRGDNAMTKKRTRLQTMIYRILHRTLKIEQHEPHYTLGVNSGRISSSSPHVARALLLWLQTR
jgi:hypothetical protein